MIRSALALFGLVLTLGAAQARAPEDATDYRLSDGARQNRVFHHFPSRSARSARVNARAPASVPTGCLPNGLKAQLAAVRKIAGDARVVSAYRAGSRFWDGGVSYQSAHALCRAFDVVVPATKRHAVLVYLTSHRLGCVITHCRGCGPIPEHIHVDDMSSYCSPSWARGAVDRWTGQRITTLAPLPRPRPIEVARRDETKPPNGAGRDPSAGEPSESPKSEKPKESDVSEEPKFVRSGPFVMARPAPIRPEDVKDIFARNTDDEYLWQVYQRTPRKIDQTGDFTWKDRAAAKKAKMSLPQYVIGGMSKRLKKALAAAGRAMDKAGIRWSMLSAFRDDYRQAIAEGVKAATGFSLHGGSKRTCGYGCGQAVDVTIENANLDKGDFEKAAGWLARYGGRYGLRRPMPGYDPAHIQLVDLDGPSPRRLGHRWHRGRMASR